MTDIALMEQCFPILIADDSPDDVFLLERALKRIKPNAKVAHVQNFGDAIRYLEGSGEFSDRKKHPYPSLVISDASMPSQSGGFDILDWFRAHPRSHPAPVIVCSGNVNPEFVRKTYQLGANSYFIKPSTVGDMESFFEAFFRYWDLTTRPKVAEPATQT